MKSSAGSGKTYALVKYFLKLALATPNSDAYTHLLAITFTNAAASEMKERVLERLHDFAHADALAGKNDLFNEIRAELAINPMQLQERANRTRSHMLHNYSRLSISTIDSFVHRIIRSFAKDLRIHPDFGIQMDTESFLEQCVDACLNEIGQDTELTTYLEKFVMGNFEEEEDWNIRSAMLGISKQLIQENSNHLLRSLEHLSLEDYTKIRAFMQTQIQGLKGPITKEAAEINALLDKHGVQMSEFYNGGRGNFTYLQKCAEGTVEMPSSTVLKSVSNGWNRKGSENATITSLEPRLNALVATLLKWFEEGKHLELKRIERILPQIYTTGLLSKLSQIARRLKDEENFLLISDFHAIISEIVQQSHAPFIYERVGERFQHILIDEFQDTSEMQWKNFIPLFENAIAQGNLTLVVGDGKQSIYRWRNGNVDQFVSLPVLHEHAHEETKQAFANAYHEELLNVNRRSAKQVVTFNNELFTKLKPALAERALVYNNHEQQVSKAHEGYVRFSLFEENDNELRKEQVLEETYQAIMQCREKGFNWSDIAILTRKGKSESTLISEYLLERSNHAIPLTTEDSFLLAHSKEVQLLMACMQYFGNRKEPFFEFSVFKAVHDLMFLNINYSESLGKYMQKIEVEKEKYVTKLNLPKFLSDHLPALLTLDQEFPHPFECLQELIRLFELPFDVYLEFLENQLLQLSHKQGMGFQELGNWWRENQTKLYIQSGQKENAVRILTVHKSKGLQYPCVIFPKFSSKSPQQNLWIQAPANPLHFEAGLVRYSPKSDLKDDMLAEEREEFGKMMLDETNLLYVATTRAEDALFLLVEAGSTSSALHKQLVDVLKKWGQNEFGSLEARPAAKEEAQARVLKRLEGTRKDRIQVKYRFREILKKEKEEREYVQTGTDFHECLAGVHRKTDLPTALEKFLSTKTNWDELKKEKITQEITHFVLESPFQGLFETSARVYTEQEIVAGPSLIMRPDRIHVFEDRVEIYDFKTGTAEDAQKKYGPQLQGYVRAVQEVFNLPTRAFVLLQKTETLVEIKI